MAIVTVSGSFEADSAGFLSRLCAGCGGRFKVDVTSGASELRHCPFCQREGERWETSEQYDDMQSLALQRVVQPQLDELNRMLRSLGSITGPNLRVEVTGLVPRVPVSPAPIELLESLGARTTSACCNASVRHGAEAQARYSISCGKAG